jgi:prepilin-type N-terminal cleavage/methylation domain-containing protein
VKREAGFTLVELLVAMVIGMVILLAAFKALDTFSVANATITARVDNTQRARQEMDGLIRALRSQVCIAAGGSSLRAATSTQVSFATDLSDGTVFPQLRTVTFDATARRITERRYGGTTFTQPLTFVGTASAGPTLNGVEQDGTTPVFRYFAYDTATPPRPIVDLGTSLSAPDLERVARIVVTYRVGPPAGSVNRAAGATLTDEVFLRNVDPSDPVPLPLCP